MVGQQLSPPVDQANQTANDGSVAPIMAFPARRLAPPHGHRFSHTS